MKIKVRHFYLYGIWLPDKYQCQVWETCNWCQARENMLNTSVKHGKHAVTAAKRGKICSTPVLNTGNMHVAGFKSRKVITENKS